MKSWVTQPHAVRFRLYKSLKKAKLSRPEKNSCCQGGERGEQAEHKISRQRKCFVASLMWGTNWPFGQCPLGTQRWSEPKINLEVCVIITFYFRCFPFSLLLILKMVATATSAHTHLLLHFHACTSQTKFTSSDWYFWFKLIYSIRVICLILYSHCFWFTRKIALQ